MEWIVIAVPYLSITVHGNDHRGCFDEDNPPTCLSAHNISQPEHNVQDICFLLKSKYLSTDDILFNVSRHAEALSHIAAASELCHAVKQVYPLCYWCATPNAQDFCLLDNCSVPHDDVLDETIDVKSTCNELHSVIYVDKQWPSSLDLCHRAEQVVHLCPGLCEDIKDFRAGSYLGADTEAKRKAMVWLSRTAAILSFFGAAFILWDVLSKVLHRSTVYHQLLFVMSSFDIMTAGGWVFSTAAIPKDEGDMVFGARGTWQTCKTQAFFLQLGFTSVFYNVSLSVYYVLVIVLRWSEDDLKKIGVFLHGLPLLVGVGLAFAALPFYDWIEYGCHLHHPPGKSLWEVLVFTVFPLGFSVFMITSSMLVVYAHVRRNARAARKWSFSVERSMSLERQVFWQALLYTLSFYITWPLIFFIYIATIDDEKNFYGLSATVSFVAPLQGFNNFLVYVRPRVVSAVQQHAKKYFSPKYFSTMFLRNRDSNLPDTSSNGETQIENRMALMDPSAEIARSNRRLFIQEDDVGGEFAERDVLQSSNIMPPTETAPAQMVDSPHAMVGRRNAVTLKRSLRREQLPGLPAAVEEDENKSDDEVPLTDDKAADCDGLQCESADCEGLQCESIEPVPYRLEDT